MFEAAILIVLSAISIALAVFVVVVILIPEARGLRESPVTPQRR